MSVDSPTGRLPMTYGCLGHHVVESLVESEVVTIGKVVVVSRQRSITLELVVSVESTLWSEAWSCSAGSGIASERELGSERVTVKANTEDSKQNSQVVADTVHVLLSVGEFSEGDDTVTAQEAVLCHVSTARQSRLEEKLTLAAVFYDTVSACNNASMWTSCTHQTWARSTNVVLARSLPSVGSVALSRHKVVGTNLETWCAIDRTTVRVLGVVWHSTLVVWVEWADI